jgi:hypothetical protein
MCIDVNNKISDCSIMGIACDDFSYASGINCIKCSTTFPGCVKCTSASCNICDYQFVLVAGACVGCPAGCKVCNAASVCLLCNDATTKGPSCEFPKQKCNSTSYYNSSVAECILCSSVNQYWAKCTSSFANTLIYRNCMSFTRLWT